MAAAQTVARPVRRGALLPLAVALAGAMGVAAGAFGAHGASGRAAEWLKTGAEYQLIHAVAALALLSGGRRGGAAWLFVVGGVIFAGTLDLMALGAPLWLGAITPVGGLLLIGGWIGVGVRELRDRPLD